MAIQKCPYCKAIIDEGAEYCTNCGTKLLFPEDELIEEEIPGEKIVEEEETEEEPEPEVKNNPRRKKPEKISKKTEKLKEAAEADLAEEAVIDVDEDIKAEADIEEELHAPETGDQDDVQTGDIEEIVDDAEKEKEEISKFVSSIKKEREEVREKLKEGTADLPPWAEGMKDAPPPQIPHTDEIPLKDGAIDEEVIEQAEDEVSDISDDEVPDIADDEVPDIAEDEVPPAEKVSPIAEVVPPVKEEVKLDTEPPIEEIPKEEEIPASDEVIIEEPVPRMDTESAFPETVDQQGLPFAGETQDGYADEDAGKKTRFRRKIPQIGFGEWLKSRIFDVCFIASLWFITLWIASRVVEVPVFKLISDSVPATLSFYAILLALYFFFFLFFLGETLGNYLFSQEE